MSAVDQHESAAPGFPPAHLLVVLLLPLLVLLPPETRGESMAGGALLLALLVLLVPPVGSSAVVLLAALVLAVPAGLVALAPGAAVEAIAFPWLGIAAGIAVAGMPDRRLLVRRAAPVLAIAGAVAALHGIYQALWGLERIAAELAASGAVIPDGEAVLKRLEARRAFAAFATPAALGGCLGLTLPVTVALALGRRWRTRNLWLLLATLQLGGLLATASATATAALGGAVGLAALGRRRLRRWLLPIGGALLLMLVGVVALRGASLLEGGTWESPWRLRAANYRAAVSMTAEHPWTGVGPGGFGDAYPAFRRPADNEVRHVHNVALELAAEHGRVAGAALAATFLWAFLSPLWRSRDEDDVLQRGVAVGLAAFALHNLGDFTAFFPSLFWTACLLRGLAARETPPLAARPVVAAGLPAIAVVAGLVAALAGLSANARHAARAAAWEGDSETGRRLSARAAVLAPWNPDAALQHARAIAGPGDPATLPVGRRQEALEQVNRALAVSPWRPASRALRGRLRASLGDLPGALADTTLAARLYPANDELAATRDAFEHRLRDEGSAP